MRNSLCILLFGLAVTTAPPMSAQEKDQGGQASRLELAAASLGAPPHRVLTTVTLPLLVPGLVSGWLFAAILSFNEFTASLFVTVQRTQTLPVALYNYVREYADPSMAAISVMYIVVTATLLILANVFLGLAKVLNVEHPR